MNPDHLERLVLALESIAASFRQWAAPAMVERALKPGQYADGGSAWARAVLGSNR